MFIIAKSVSRKPTMIFANIPTIKVQLMVLGYNLKKEIYVITKYEQIKSVSKCRRNQRYVGTIQFYDFPIFEQWNNEAFNKCH